MPTAMIAEIDEPHRDPSYHVMVMGDDGCLRKIPGNNGWKTYSWAEAELITRQKSGDFTTPNWGYPQRSRLKNSLYSHIS